MATIDDFIAACQELDDSIGEPGSPALLFALTATGAIWQGGQGTAEGGDTVISSDGSITSSGTCACPSRSWSTVS